MACCNICKFTWHSTTLWPVCAPYCEIWNLRHYSYNAEFMVSFCTLMFENLREGRHIFDEQGLIGFKSGRDNGMPKRCERKVRVSTVDSRVLWMQTWMNARWMPLMTSRCVLTMRCATTQSARSSVDHASTVVLATSSTSQPAVVTVSSWQTVVYTQLKLMSDKAVSADFRRKSVSSDSISVNGNQGWKS